MARLPHSSRKRSRPRQDGADPDEAQSRRPTQRLRRDASDARDQTRPTSSISSLGPDPEEWYGYGDDDALYNLFSTATPACFTTIPRPHGSQGLDEPWWELRDSEIYLSLDFPTPARPMHRVRQALPGPVLSERLQARRDAKAQEKERRTQLRGLDTRFRSALEVHREEDTESQPTLSGCLSYRSSPDPTVTQERITTSRETATS
jgi:hypothetical protein